MNKKILFIGTAIAVLFIFGSYYAIAQTSSDVSVATYKSTDAARPQVEVKQTKKDFGAIKVSDTATATFAIKNVGKVPLQLFDISSSCGCTVGKVSYNGQESTEFGMHSAGDFATPISPETTATVTVIYRPFVMPVYGAVEREVYVSTNDPSHTKLVFQVTANVH